MGWGGVAVAHEILVSAQGPFLGFWVLGLGLRGLGPGLDNSNTNREKGIWAWVVHIMQ